MTQALALPTSPRTYAETPAPLEEPDTTYSVVARAWTLRRTYALDLPGTGARLEIPRGFRYDGASIPRWALPFISRMDLSEVAPLVHDYLYFVRGCPQNGEMTPARAMTRREVDDIFLAIMERQGVAPWKRAAAHLAVRLFARRWRGADECSVEDLAEGIIQEGSTKRAVVEIGKAILKASPSIKVQAARVGLSMAKRLWQRRKMRRREKLDGDRPGLLDTVLSQEALPAPRPEARPENFTATPTPSSLGKHL